MSSSGSGGSLCKTSVLRIYQEVIEDVMNNAREPFLEEGIDEQVLQELRHTWRSKLEASKALQADEVKPKAEVTSTTATAPQPPPPPATASQLKGGGGATANGLANSNSTNNKNNANISNSNSKQQQQMVGSQAAAAPAHSHHHQILDTKMVPIQITLPAQTPGTSPRTLTIQVPAVVLQGNQLQNILTGPVITRTMLLPEQMACCVLQQHVNDAFRSKQHQIEAAAAAAAAATTSKSVVQSDGAADEALLYQVDGPRDTSDEEDDGSDDNDDDDDLDDDKDDEYQEMEDEGGEEEPLNSEDDVTDDDPSDLFDTDNIVVCQYDKIIRNRNKWKFYLKDGIMNLSGLDYVFQRANGDAEW